MMQAVKGIYRDGKVELLEAPTGITEGEVIVTFVRLIEEGADPTQTAEESKPTNQRSKMMRLGMFSDSGREGLTLEDCKIAEFHGDSDDGLDWS